MTAKEVLHSTEDKLKKVIEFVTREFSEVRTGRASPHIVEGLHVDYYGTPTVLKQLAAITALDAHMLVIQPWDPTAIAEIEKAILKSNLGLNPSNDGKLLRLAVPPLSKERRDELVKIVHKKTEDGRVSIRTTRHEAKSLIEKLEKDKVISEDDKFRAIDELQKLVDKYIVKLEDLLKNKDKELTQF